MRSKWLASGLAVVAALAVVGLARWAGDDLEVDARGQVVAVPVAAVVLATLVGAASGQALRLLSLRAARPRGTFWFLAALGLAISSVPPLTAATDAATSEWLLLAHAAVAAVVLPAFSRGLPARAGIAIGGRPE